jgi:hypothetical protein
MGNNCGSKHFTHVYNNTEDDVYVCLKASGSMAALALKPKEVRSVQVNEGAQTISVYECVGEGVFYTNPSDSRTDKSGRSYIVNRVFDDADNAEGRIKIESTVFGHTLTKKKAKQAKKSLANDQRTVRASTV